MQISREGAIASDALKPCKPGDCSFACCNSQLSGTFQESSSQPWVAGTDLIATTAKPATRREVHGAFGASGGVDEAVVPRSVNPDAANDDIVGLGGRGHQGEDLARLFEPDPAPACPHKASTQVNRVKSRMAYS